MSIKEQVKADMKEAMKNKEKEKLAALRNLNSAVQNIEIERKTDLKDEDIVEVINKEIKQTKESIEAYENAGSEDEANRLRERVKTLEKYLPEQMGEDEIREFIKNLISEHGIQGKQDKGKLMKVLMPQVKGRADNKMVSNIVDEILNQ